MHTVYMHIVPNGKRYVGITSGTVHCRFGKDGYKYRNQFFGRAIRKYGWDNIEHIIVATNLSREWASQLERILIHQYNCADPIYGYNLTYGGEYNVQPNEAVRQKMREAQLGTRQSEETKKKKSASLTGRHLSAEHRARISASIKKMHTHTPTTLGRVWVNNGVQARMIKPEDLDSYLNNGYVRGQKLSN